MTEMFEELKEAIDREKFIKESAAYRQQIECAVRAKINELQDEWEKSLVVLDTRVTGLTEKIDNIDRRISHAEISSSNQAVHLKELLDQCRKEGKKIKEILTDANVIDDTKLQAIKDISGILESIVEKGW